MCRCESGWSPQFRWAEVRRLSLQNEGVVAHRERAAGRESGVAGSIPACEAPYLRHHLSIESFRRAAELGLSAKALQWASRFKPCATGQPVDGPTRFLSVANSIGPKVVGYLTQLVEYRPRKPEAAGSIPASDAVPCPMLFHFDGSQDWVIACNARGRRFESGLRL